MGSGGFGEVDSIAKSVHPPHQVGEVCHNDAANRPERFMGWGAWREGVRCQPQPHVSVGRIDIWKQLCPPWCLLGSFPAFFFVFWINTPLSPSPLVFLPSPPCLLTRFYFLPKIHLHHLHFLHRSFVTFLDDDDDDDDDGEDVFSCVSKIKNVGT